MLIQKQKKLLKSSIQAMVRQKGAVDREYKEQKYMTLWFHAEYCHMHAYGLFSHRVVVLLPTKALDLLMHRIIKQGEGDTV